MKVSRKCRRDSLYSPWKVAHLTEKIEALRRGELIAPQHVQMDPTGRCNNDCLFCFYRSAGFKHLEFVPSEQIPTEVATKLIDEMADLSVPALELTGGGEPLLFPAIREVLDRVAKRDLELALVTNGSLLTKDILDRITNPKWIRFSVDAATPTTHRLVHRVPDQFSTVLANLQGVIDNGFTDCVVGVSFIIQPENYSEILQAAEVFKQMGVDNVRFSYAYTSKFDKLLSNDQRKEVNMLLSEAKKLENDQFKVFVMDTRLDDFAPKPKTFTFCGYQMFVLQIGCDSLVYPCCLLPDETVLAYNNHELKNLPIKEIRLGMELPSFGPVTHHFERHYDGLIYKITLQNGQFLNVTEDHPCFRGFGMELVPARNLVVGDMLPTLTKIEDPRHRKRYYILKINPPLKVKNGRVWYKVRKRSKYSLPKQVPITPELARLLGYYVAEGWVDKDGVTFMFGHHESALIEDVEKCLDKLEMPHNRIERPTGIMVSVSAFILRELMVQMGCGARSYQKAVPSILFSACNEIKREFLRAYGAGDGHYEPKTRYMSYGTTSKKLASDLYILFKQLGVVTVHIFSKKENRGGSIDGRKIVGRSFYQIGVAGVRNLRRLGMNARPAQRDRRYHTKYTQQGEYTFIPIKRIETSLYSGSVFDVEVAGSHKFAAGVGQIVTHNCVQKYDKKYAYGNVRKQSFKEILFGEERRKYVEEFSVDECLPCWLRDRNEFIEYLLAENPRHLNFI